MRNPSARFTRPDYDRFDQDDWDGRITMWEPLLRRIAYRFEKGGEWINGADIQDLIQEGRCAIWLCYAEDRPVHEGYLAACAMKAMHHWVYRVLDRENPAPYELMLHIEDGSLEHELYAADLKGELVLG